MMRNETRVDEYTNCSRIREPSCLMVPIRTYPSIPRSTFINVLKTLRNLEIENEIQIHYAVELGSRTYGLHNRNSDYDLRFVFSYRNRAYVSEQIREYAKKCDCIGGDHIEDGVHIDYQGWQLQKFMKLLKKQNVMAIEILESPIIYFDRSHFRKNFTGVLNLLPNNRVNRTMFYHYLKMARTNYDAIQRDARDQIKETIAEPILTSDLEEDSESDSYIPFDETTPLLTNSNPIILYKKYLTVVRPLLQSIYILTHDIHTSEKLIFDFDTLLKYLETRIGIKSVIDTESPDISDEISDESSTLAELDITSDSDRSSFTNSFTNSFTDEGCDCNADLVSLSELMIEGSAWSELQIIVYFKRKTSTHYGPLMTHLNDWMGRTIDQLSDPNGLVSRFDQIEKDRSNKGKIDIGPELAKVFQNMLF